MCVLLSALAIVLGGYAWTAPPAHAISETDINLRIYNDTTAHRRANGLPALTRNYQMDLVARNWSIQQCTANKMSHNPNYSTQIPAGWQSAGENVAVGYSYTVVVSAWIASPGHNRNLLGNWTHIGLGYCNKNGTPYYTQVFARYPGSVSGDYSGNTPAAATGVYAINSSGSLYRYAGNGEGGFTSARLIGPGWNAMTMVVGAGDLNRDGTPDLVARDTSNRLWFYPGKPSGGFGSKILIGGGWGGMNLMIGIGDLTRDGKSDLLARDTSGRLWLYAGLGNGKLASAKQIGFGWGTMTAMVGVGDITRDGFPDLVARTSNGTLYTYPGTASGRLGAKILAGERWNSFNVIVGTRDMLGNGRPDIVGRTADGSMYLYTSDGKGGWITIGKVGSGWGSLRIIGYGAR